LLDNNYFVCILHALDTPAINQLKNNLRKLGIKKNQFNQLNELNKVS